MNELDLKSLWKELDTYEAELIEEEKLLNEVWTKIAELKTKAEAEIASLHATGEYDFIDSDEIVRMNIGGQVFEATAGALTRDPNSILAGICRKTPIIDGVGEPVTYYFERDWWIFRHIMNYLRSNILPNELETLKEMYTEASYYRLESLQKSIEDVPLERVVSDVAPQMYLNWPTVNVDRLLHLTNSK